MSQQKQVRELFALPKKEVIFDDFGCALRSGIIHHGRMYLTENYICFYSSLVGINKKIIIPLIDIVKMTKVKSLGMFNSLHIHQQGRAKPYKFSSFTDCDSTFKIINKLWGNVSPHAKDPDAVSEEEENENDRSNSMQNEKSSIVESGLGASGPQSDKDSFPNLEQKPAAVQNNQNSISINSQEEEKEKAKPEIIVERSRSDGSDLAKHSSPQQVLQEEFKEGDKPQQLVLPENHLQSSNSIHQNMSLNKEKGSQNKEVQEEYYSKEDLEKLLEPFQPIGENYTELITQCFSLSAKEFFSNHITESAPTSLFKFFEERGEQKIVTQPWKEPEPAEEYDSKGVLLAGQMSLDLSIKGNPFISKAPSQKYFKVLEKTDTKINIRVLNKCTGVPYCDAFACEEDWLILSPTPTANCCIIRITFQVIFYKNTMFRGKIQTSSIKGGSDVWVEWADWLKKKGYALKERKQPMQPVNPSKLTHGIEKSNKLFEKEKKNEQVEEAQPQENNKNKTIKEKAVVKYQQTRTYVLNNRSEAMLIVVIFMMMMLYFKMCRIESLLLSQQCMNKL